jgi:superfamily II DNA or RNA helicase
MVNVSERIVSIGVSGDSADLTAIVDKLKYKHPHARRIISHALYKQSGGEAGWDGYIRPLKKVTPDGQHAEALRGYKRKILDAIEQLHIELDPESKLLESPFLNITSADIPDDIIKAKFSLDENQREIIAAWLKHGMGIGKIAVNGGKTAAFAGFAAMLKSLEESVRVLYITDRERLTSQVDHEMRGFLPAWHITKFGGGDCDESGQDMVVCTLAMLRQHVADLRETGWFKTFNAIMFDECFAAGTLVDGRPIQTLNTGDYVWSVNQLGFLEKRKVERVFKKRPSALVRITVDGSPTVCTANHPIFVYGKGYVRADAITVGSSVMKSIMQPRSYNYGSRVPLVQNIVYTDAAMADKLRQARQAPLLQIGVRKGFCGQSIIGDNGCNQQEVRVQENERKQSDVEARSKRAGNKKNPVLQQAATSSRGERKIYGAADIVVVESWGRMVNGSGRRDGHQGRKPEEITLLQSGFGSHRDEAGGRSGRPFALFQETETDRRLEDCTATRGRVDSVEILEPRSDEELRKLCPDGYVYNIEVEENHNYFANSVLVHNCHHAAAPSVDVILQEFKGAFYRVAASDTIKSDDPIKHDHITGLCGPVLLTVHQNVLIEAGRSAIPHIYLIDPKEWLGCMDAVPYRPNPGSRAWVLLDGEDAMRKGVYAGPVYERDDKGNIKTKKSKVLNGTKIESMDVEVTVPGLHTISIDGLDYEIDASYCLLERSTDRCIVNFKERNDLIAQWVKYFSGDQGKRTVVVATRTIHVLVLEALLTATKGIDPAKVMTLVGEDSPARRNKVFAWFKKTPGAILVTPLIKEGVSINEIEAGVIADYVGDYEYFNQILGRFIRKKEGENRAEIVAFVDRQQKRFEKGCTKMLVKVQKIKGYVFYWPCVLPGSEKDANVYDSTAEIELSLDTKNRQKLLGI